MVTPAPLNIVSAYRRLRDDARRALPALIVNRDALLESNSLIGKDGEPIPGTCEPWAAREAALLTRLIETIEAQPKRRKP